MVENLYPGINFPDRAEALDRFASYRVFLEPWNALAKELRELWEALAIRGESSIFAIHGQQGAGKTLLTSKLVKDFELSRSSLQQNPDEGNIWHRIVGWRHDKLNGELISSATNRTVVTRIKNDPNWVATAKSFMDGQQDRACILLADNAERAYFAQGLVNMDDMQFAQVGHSDAATRLFAERLVEQMRGELRGSLLVLLSNNEEFLKNLQAQIESQHRGLMRIRSLELPDSKTKETIIRVNTNRANPVTYWATLDQAPQKDRVALKRALEGESSFPDSFRAVDRASRTRIGRPANRNVITLITLADVDDANSVATENLGTLTRTEVDHQWMTLHYFEDGWTPVDMASREASLLSSEWVLRVCTLGRPFVRSLLESTNQSAVQHFAAVTNLLEKLKVFQGVGINRATRKKYTTELESIIDTWPTSQYDCASFWGAGQARSTQYERALKNVLPTYDSGGAGFRTYRPDFIVSPFRPAAVTEAAKDADIKSALKRDAHVFEFTALSGASAKNIEDYLKAKLPNYVDLTQEQ